MGNYLSKPAEEIAEEPVVEESKGKTRSRKLRRRPTARRKKTLENNYNQITD
jgi:hypothetical protein